MKKFTSLLLVFLFLLSITGCNGSTISDSRVSENEQKNSVTENTSDKSNKHALSLYLDEINMAADMSGLKFLSQLSKYSYNGKPIAKDKSDMLVTSAALESRLQENKQLFGYYSERDISDDSKYVDVRYYFFTKVPLDGFKLPCKIKFDDDLQTVIKKLGGNYKALDNFLEDDSALSWTIYESEGESVKLYKCTKTSETGETEYDCEITYTETCKYRDYRYEVNTVTRYVIMTFAPETHKVASFKAAVNQRSGYVRIDIE